MKLSGLDVRIRRLVVDAEHRALATGLSDDIGRSLRDELTGAIHITSVGRRIEDRRDDCRTDRATADKAVGRRGMSLTSSPKLIKGGLVVLAPGGGAVRNTIALQYNPDSLTRSYQVQGVGGDGGGERAQPFRLKGPAIETIKLEAEIDATDQLEHPDNNANAVAFGIGAADRARSKRWSIRASRRFSPSRRQAQNGTLEILPPEAPLVLFVWSKNRVVPVRVTEFSVTEEAFDPVAQSDPRQGEPRPACAQHRRPRLHPQGRHHVPELPARSRDAGHQGGLGVAGLDRPHQPAVTEKPDDDRSRPSPDRRRRHPDQPVRAQQPL